MERTPQERCTTCGAEIRPEACLRECYEARRLSFCSPRCQARFEADPERYVGETQGLARPPGYR